MGNLRKKLSLYKYVVFAVVSVLAANKCTSALSTFVGDEPSRWEDDKTSVVLATVRDVKEARADSGDFTATFVPRATLAGSFDCGVHAELRMRFSASVLGGTSILHPPKDGDLVMAVISPSPGGDGFDVLAEFCRFMPGTEGMVTVNGFDDQKVTETLQKIRHLRLKRESVTRPTTKATKG